MIAEANCYKRGGRRCKWYMGVHQPTGEEQGGEWHRCLAYPYGIPSEIAYGEDLHEEIKEDQVGDYVYAEA